jgi:serine phosphatase RsbU (regulator of sigma subunit)
MTLRTRTLLLITGLLVMTVLATSAVLAWAWFQALRTQTMEDATVIARLLGRSAVFAAEVRQSAEDAVGDQMLVQATILAHFVAVAEAQGLSPEEINQQLRSIIQRSELDEIWITDETGHAYLRSVPEIDFVFRPDQAQAGKFWPLLTGEESRVVQETRTREVDTRAFKYAGVAGIDRPRIVQVGFEAGFLDRLADQVGLPRLVRELVSSGQIVALRVVDQDGDTLANEAMPGWRPDAADAAATATDLLTALSEQRTVSRLEPTGFTVIAPIAGDTPGTAKGAVLVRLPTERVVRAVRDQLALTALIVALALVAGSLGAIALAHNVTLPIARLTAAVAQIQGGKLEPATLRGVVARKDEIGQLGLALQEYARLSADQVRQAVVQFELERAWQIQSKLLPPPLEGWPGALEVAVLFQPARETSGDFYDVFSLAPPDGEPGGAAGGHPPLAPLQIAVADVAGKGIAAALVMALARATLRATADSAVLLPQGQIPSPATTLRLASRRLHADVGLRDFVCCALAVVEPPNASGAGPRLRLANAGQVPPILCRADAAREIDPAGERLPLGVLADPEYTDLQLTLAPGDVVLFATDGLPEAPARPALTRPGPSGDGDRSAPLPPPTADGELFGFERLAASAVHWSARAPSAAAIAQGVWADVLAWSGDDSRHDDMTLLVLRVPSVADAPSSPGPP